ncbi:MAG: FAD-dependent oxidoreductase [Flavobacteriaceae bacterium]|nr:MAG: FAD-dependent oxidoreductase [Flavobacteriaceae bacterium]
MKVDYIVVGMGLAGIAFSKKLLSEGKSFVVFENESQHSSVVAGGMYNPVVLKRFTPVWNAKDQLEIALPFYKELELELKATYNHPLPIHRIFKSVEEQNNWFVACDKPLMQEYMIPEVGTDKTKGLVSDFGYGELVNTGRIDTKRLIEDYRQFLNSKEVLKKETFDYKAMEHLENGLNYKGLFASKIVFCEGYGMLGNPLFSSLPMQEAKGELITIHAPELKIDYLIKAAVFVMPIGDDLYKVGATFNWKDKTNTPTLAGKEELLMKLDMFLTTPYTIVDHVAGIRPTVKDRRPLVGIHDTFKHCAILNGLGTRGVMIAPQAAAQLYNCLEHQIPIPKDVCISRFNR